MRESGNERLGGGWVALGSLSAFLAVLAGAFAAHGLRERLEPSRLEAFETAARYEMYHALGLVAVGLWVRYSPSAFASLAGWAFAVGTVLFSGSLYLLAVNSWHWLGPVTPFGGVCFLLGWLSLALAAVPRPRQGGQVPRPPA
jgi:uncharacterized membrane protein YgdD (TMEM256/DUF423 family)